MILLDTSGLMALHHADQPRHGESRVLFDAAGPRLVHSYILAEFVALADARGLPRASALAFLESLVVQPDVEVAWVDGSLHREGMKHLAARLDKAVFPGRFGQFPPHAATEDRRGPDHRPPFRAGRFRSALWPFMVGHSREPGDGTGPTRDLRSLRLGTSFNARQPFDDDRVYPSRLLR